MTPTDLEQAAAAIESAGLVALACHTMPDGDALGSLLALHHLCRANGKPSVASWSEPFVVAPHYQFLPGLHLATKPQDFPVAPEVMVTFDCGSFERLGGLAENARAARQLVVVDHHATNQRFGTINVVDAGAAATAVMVRRLAREMGWPLTRDVAVCLYTGLVTDTGRFQYANTTPEVFELARELSEFDLPIAEITRKLFEEHRFAYLQLVARCLERAQLDDELGFVATWISLDDLAELGVELEETEGLIDLVRRTREAEVSAVVKETGDGVRVSLRAISQVDVGAIATRLGGGGHKFAAGFERRGTVPDTLDAIRRELAAELGRG